jgi:hypothetical protein
MRARLRPPPRSADRNGREADHIRVIAGQGRENLSAADP